MPSPVANLIRETIVQCHQNGESLRSIRDELNLSYKTVNLGRQLTTWGEQLQERYDRVSQITLDLPPFETVSK